MRGTPSSDMSPLIGTADAKDPAVQFAGSDRVNPSSPALTDAGALKTNEAPLGAPRYSEISGLLD